MQLTKMSPALRVLAVVGMLVALNALPASGAGDAGSGEADKPEEAKAGDKPASTDEEPNQQSEIEQLGVAEEVRPGFLEGTDVLINPRTYDLRRDRDIDPDTVGWALGGSVEYRSGWWLDRIRVAATVFTSQVLHGPEDKDGTLLFRPGPEPITVLGEANLTARIAGRHGTRIGRQRFELPYLGSHDIRMVPNTFEAIAFGNKPADGFAYMFGYVDAIKRKNDEEFVSMARAAGADSDDGVGFVGGRYAFKNGALIGAIDQYTFDVFNTLFIKAEHRFKLAEERSLGVNLQYTDQRSVGDELIGDFSTSPMAAKVELFAGNTTWRVAASTTDDERGIQKPYGNPANYLSVIVDDFDRAGEDAWLVGFSQNLGRRGPGDLSLFTNVVVGNTPDVGPAASPDETEYDLTVDYRVREGWGDRLWFRVRGAYVDQDNDLAGANDFFDFRIIVNYTFDAL